MFVHILVLPNHYAKRLVNADYFVCLMLVHFRSLNLLSVVVLLQIIDPCGFGEGGYYID